MKKSRAPYILLVILLLVLFFILGTRYGQKVKIADKEISVLLSLTPSKSPAPTKKISYKKFSNKVCGLNFLYPSDLNVLNMGSDSATFSANKKDVVLGFSCEKTDPFAKLEAEKVASESIQFASRPVQAKTIKKSDQKYLFFSLINPVNSKTVYFITTDNLYPLLDNTLNFASQ